VALVGGETAEHPGLLGPAEYDLAGAATGVVEYAEILGAHRVVPGDVVLALASTGLHSNGFSLANRAVARAGWELDREVPELGRSIGLELLEPTRVYAADLLDLIALPGVEIHALAHVTGGGLVANLARVLPRDVYARLDRSTWTPAPVFGLIGRLGDVPPDDLERTLNMGVGFLAVLPTAGVDDAVRHLAGRGIPSWMIGTVTALDGAEFVPGHETVRAAKGVEGGAVQLVGEYAPA
jgi:phosphoribosylformylglycinamidine cyclo-ligase